MTLQMIRPARQVEAEILTKISFRSKKHWGYPEAYFEIWADELTIHPEYIRKNDVFVYSHENEIIGYYSIVSLAYDIDVSGITLGKGHWLEHMFLLPTFIGKGFGRRMFSHAVNRCAARGIRKLGVLSDPNAKGFYEKMGCAYQREYPSTIAGRTTPFLTFRL